MIILKEVTKDGYDFFTGVPDSGLKSFIKEIHKSEFEHIPATNEGQAIGIAVGAELVGMKSCVYLQNSGLGNCINALTSLCIPHDIHPLLIVGHRHTLPQHEVMGRVDKQMLDLIGYSNYIIVDGDNNVK
jgi:phosphonopyruvate decarboxylase